MTFIPRTLGVTLLQVVEQYPVVYLTGPRQSGKTTLAQHVLPGYRYLSLEQPRTRDEAVNDPERFLSRVAKGAPGVILDEVHGAADRSSSPVRRTSCSASRSRKAWPAAWQSWNCCPSRWPSCSAARRSSLATTRGRWRTRPCPRD